jgi:hypothetical protein
LKIPYLTEHRRKTPENDAGKLHRPDLLFFRGEELPQQDSPSTPSLSSSYKQGRRPELPQALPVVLKPLSVSYSTSVSVFLSRSIPIALGFEAKNSPRAQITIDDLELRNPNACEI